MRERIFNIVQRARPGDVVSHAYDVFIVAVAFLSIVPLMFRPQDMTPQMAAVMNMIDVVTVYLLFLDYILRWMTHDFKVGKAGKLGKGGWRVFARYPFTPLAIIDMLAILPSLGVLPESLKFLRVLRVTKMFRYSKNLTIVANVFRAQRNTLLSVLAVALMYIFVSGLVMFVNEPNTFDNFFDALYWATTALTTVGYGDVYPVTDLGKFISMASSLFGIAVIALPAGIITGGFLEQVRQRDEDAEAYFRASERDPFEGANAFFVRKRARVGEGASEGGGVRRHHAGMRARQRGAVLRRPRSRRSGVARHRGHCSGRRFAGAGGGAHRGFREQPGLGCAVR